MDIERNRHPPGALAADHPIRPTLDHRADAVLRARGDPASLLDGGAGGLAECFPPPSLGGAGLGASPARAGKTLIGLRRARPTSLYPPPTSADAEFVHTDHPIRGGADNG